MSQLLLDRLEFIRTKMREQRQSHLRLLGKLIQRNVILEESILVPLEKWGMGYVPQPFNRYMNRFGILLITLYYGRFQMAREIVGNTYLPWFNLRRGTLKHDEKLNSIMYDIHSIVEIFTNVVIEDYKKKTRLTPEQILERVDEKVRQLRVG